MNNLVTISNIFIILNLLALALLCVASYHRLKRFYNLAPSFDRTAPTLNFKTLKPAIVTLGVLLMMAITNTYALIDTSAPAMRIAALIPIIAFVCASAAFLLYLFLCMIRDFFGSQ